MDQQVFRTRREAQIERAGMIGWDAKVSRIFWPNHPMADKLGYVWVIRVQDGLNDAKYLREDGYVR